MKVIFLDVDGVLNGYGRFTEIIYFLAKKLRMLGLLKHYHDIFGVHTRKVKLLSKIVKKTGAKIVLSSSWRFGWDVPYEEKDGHQRKLVDKLAKYGMTIRDRTGYARDAKSATQRETEIREWLSSHDNVKSFVVLDDEQYDLKGFIGKELVKTSEKDYIQGNWYENTGLKRKHVKQAIKILNSK